MCSRVFDELTKIKAVSKKEKELTNDDDLSERDFHLLHFKCSTTFSTMEIMTQLDIHNIYNW